MNILICDDDTAITAQLQEYVELYFKKHHIDVRIVITNSGEEAVNKKLLFDIAFLDVQMKGMNGIKTGYNLKEKNKNILIFFITFYENYLDEAFDLKAFRFLKKPLDIKRLYNGLDSALTRTHKIFIRTSGSYIKVDINSIVCVYIENRKTNIITTARQIGSTENLAYWKKQLGNVLFSQPHYSYIVNLNYVAMFEKNFLILQYGKTQLNIPCSERKYKQFRKDFLKFIQQRC